MKRSFFAIFVLILSLTGGFAQAMSDTGTYQYDSMVVAEIANH